MYNRNNVTTGYTTEGYMLHPKARNLYRTLKKYSRTLRDVINSSNQCVYLLENGCFMDNF